MTTEPTTRPRRPSPTLDALTAAASRTRFGSRAAASPAGDAQTRILSEVAAPIPRAEQVVVRVATHFVGCYLAAVHGENEPEIDEPAAVEAFAAELRKVRRDWRARRSQIQGVDALAADEILGMLKQLDHFTGFGREGTHQERSETGATIRGFFGRVAIRVDGKLQRTSVALHHLIGDPEVTDDPSADYAVTKPSWAADLEEAQRVTAGDREPEVTGDRGSAREAQKGSVAEVCQVEIPWRPANS